MVAVPDRVESLKAIALGISRSKQAEEPAELGVLLLRDIRDEFATERQDRLPSTRLLADLNILDESPWPAWSRGRGLDPRGLARLLRPFKIEPHNLRMPDGSVVKGYERADFEDAWVTYLPALAAATPLQPA
jgi:hypothetical protein